MIKFTFYGDAVGKGRPRYSQRGGYVHTYTPKKTKEFEDAIKQTYLIEHKGEVPAYPKEKALYVEMIIGVAVPKSYTNLKRAECINGYISPTKKPDIDNVVKSVLDALNGLAYEDDSQVIQIYAFKKYTDEPYIDITIGERGEL